MKHIVKIAKNGRDELTLQSQIYTCRSVAFNILGDKKQLGVKVNDQET